MPMRFVAQHVRSISRIRIRTAPTAMPTMAPDDSTVSSRRKTTSEPANWNFRYKFGSSMAPRERDGIDGLLLCGIEGG